MGHCLSPVCMSGALVMPQAAPSMLTQLSLQNQRRETARISDCFSDFPICPM